jgi:hypothetical protein
VRPAATPTPQPSSSPGTVLWKTGDGTLGAYTLPAVADGQCSGVAPTVSGANASFTVLRNTNAPYTYNGTNFASGASTCWRNQMNPMNASGQVYEFKLGLPQKFTFQTVVNLNGNVLYEGVGNGIAIDIPAIVWQSHAESGAAPYDNGQPCAMLVIQNTYAAYVNGDNNYGVIPDPGGGQAIWNFHSCAAGESDFTGPAYNSPDIIQQGQVDTWEIDITPEMLGTAGSSIKVIRNGAVVYNTTSPICDNTGLPNQCWWNYGAYMFHWKDSAEPPGWNNAGVNVQVNNMTLQTQ